MLGPCILAEHLLVHGLSVLIGHNVEGAKPLEHERAMHVENVNVVWDEPGAGCAHSESHQGISTQRGKGLDFLSGGIEGVPPYLEDLMGCPPHGQGVWIIVYTSKQAIFSGLEHVSVDRPLPGLQGRPVDP